MVVFYQLCYHYALEALQIALGNLSIDLTRVILARIDKESVPSVVIPTQPGDAIVFDYRLKHATCHSSERRRMFTICASERFREEDMPSLKKMVEDLRQISKGKVFQDDFVKNAPEKRLRHLDQSLACFADKP